MDMGMNPRHGDLAQLGVTIDRTPYPSPTKSTGSPECATSPADTPTSNTPPSTPSTTRDTPRTAP